MTSKRPWSQERAVLPEEPEPSWRSGMRSRSRRPSIGQPASIERAPARAAAHQGRRIAGGASRDSCLDRGRSRRRVERMMGLVGIVSKRLISPYRSGSSRDWIKVKNPDSPARARAGLW
jgi:hypothetical protein